MKKVALLITAAMLLLAACQTTPQPDSSLPQSSSLPESSSQSSGLDLSNIPLPESSSSQPQSESTAGSSEEPKTFRLVVPEGFTLPKIGMRLEEMGVCTAQEFVDASVNGDFSGYPLVAQQVYNANRCFVLEGYLFPDTYEFYKDVTPAEIIQKILSNTENRLSADLLDRVAQSGYTLDQVLTMASIIEKESFGDDIMPMVSSVIHNRLAIGQRLEMDVTISYVENVIKPFITGDKDRYNEWYNTYKCAALPAGAICNPGLAAIEAALAPAQTPYYFFVTDKDSNYLFAETFEEHKENVAKAGL